MKIKSSFLVLIFLLISCESKEPNFSKEIIRNFSESSEVNDTIIKVPPPISYQIDLYVKASDKEILLSSVSELLFIYKNHYFLEFDSFAKFLNAVLNQDYVLDNKVHNKKTYLESFKVNPNIEKDFNRLGIKGFLTKYSKETASKRIALKREIIKEGEYSTIAYILFKNGYDLSSDCYLGIDYIRKREESFK
ncbi:hypothetical protein [Flavobacterium psychrolimnae]|uniref:Lipoprotein n=1 Tax=Flavobacterium psychrolimnae TaxID=249351 RepID=A0A366B2I2_9FLAO|nr:hypothetical protein [Flavobacterium psychrolimnae]RBN51216.1 hypothetical protein DR980_05200 [Flavobacterium psychrolimnae]